MMKRRCGKGTWIWQHGLWKAYSGQEH